MKLKIKIKNHSVKNGVIMLRAAVQILAAGGEIVHTREFEIIQNRTTVNYRQELKAQLLAKAVLVRAEYSDMTDSKVFEEVIKEIIEELKDQ